MIKEVYYVEGIGNGMYALKANGVIKETSERRELLMRKAHDLNLELAIHELKLKNTQPKE